MLKSLRFTFFLPNVQSQEDITNIAAVKPIVIEDCDLSFLYRSKRFGNYTLSDLEKGFEFASALNYYDSIIETIRLPYMICI